MAPRSGACVGAGHGSRGCSVLRFLQFVLELLADAGLQGRGCEPLLREATLEKRDTGAEVGKPIDPARNLFPTENLQRRRSVALGERVRLSGPPPRSGGSGRQVDTQKTHCPISFGAVTSSL